MFMKHSFKEWLAVTRYWSFPVSTMPVIVTFAWLFSRGEIPCEFKPYLAFTDNLGSILSVVDENGDKVFGASYDAWGCQSVAYGRDFNLLIIQVEVGV